MFGMTNPLWQFVFAPFLVGSVGWWLRGCVDRADARAQARECRPEVIDFDPRPRRVAYDWAREAPWVPDLRVVPRHPSTMSDGG